MATVILGHCWRNWMEEEEEEEGMEGDVGKGSEKKKNRIAYRTIVFFFFLFFVVDIMEESCHQLPFVMTVVLLLYVHGTGRAGINFKAPDWSVQICASQYHRQEGGSESEFGSIHHTAVWALLALKMKIILLSGLLYICLLLFGFLW